MMTFSLLNLLQILIAFQGLFFGLHLLIGKREKRSANRTLAALLILLAMHMISNVARDFGFAGSVIELPQLFGLLYGPLLYLYVRALAYHSARFRPEDLLHGVPSLTVVVIWTTSSLSVNALAICIFASIGSYLALSFLLLRHYRSVLHETRSHLTVITLSWLRSLLWLLLTVLVFNMVSYATPYVAPGPLDYALTFLLFSLLLLFVTTIVLKGLRQPELFSGITVEDEAIALEGAQGRRQPASELDDHLPRKLETFMEEQRPYLDPDLTIAGLASQIGIPARTLSRLINSRFKTNFSDFVNAYRIESAESRLLDPHSAGDSILEILYSVGFNSKSSFNAAFKRKARVTPSQYKKQHADTDATLT